MKLSIPNKKGFSVMEVIVSIFLLFLVITLVLSLVFNTLNNQKSTLYNIQIDNIKKGAAAWSGKNISLMPTQSGESISITLGELEYKGLVEKNLINPKTESEFPDNLLITIINKNETYFYIVEETTDSNINYDPEAPYIILNGLPTEYIEIQGNYVEKGVIARSKDDIEIDSVDVTIEKEETTVSDINTDNLSTYVITYTATDSTNNKSSSVSRNIIIQDTLAPVITVNGCTKNQTITINTGTTFNAPSASIVDNSGEIIIPTLTGTVDSNTSGTYELIYEAKDSNNNIGRLILTVVVKD